MLLVLRAASEAAKLNSPIQTESFQLSSLLQAFSHWTWQVTKGQLMVVDVQGLLSKDKEYVLVDPAIHCPSDPSRFTKTNLIDIGECQAKGQSRSDQDKDISEFGGCPLQL